LGKESCGERALPNKFMLPLPFPFPLSFVFKSKRQKLFVLLNFMRLFDLPLKGATIRDET